MTQAMHNLIAVILLMVTWHLAFKKYFVRTEEVDFWSQWLDKKFFND